MRSRPGAGTCRAHPAPVGLPPSLGRASSGPRNPAQHQLQASPPVTGSAQRGAETSKLQLSPLRWVQSGRMWVWPQDPPNMNEGLHRLRGDCPLPCVPSATMPRLVRQRSPPGAVGSPPSSSDLRANPHFYRRRHWPCRD